MPSTAMNAHPPHAIHAAHIQAAQPIRQLVATIPMGDGCELQTVTEWWGQQPTSVKSWPDPDRDNVWVTSRIYDPVTRLYHSPLVPSPASLSGD